MRFAGHNRHTRLDVEPRRRPLYQRQQHEHQQKRRNHIYRHRCLVTLLDAEIGHGDGRIRDQDVQTVQLVLGAPAKGPNALKGAQVERPHLDDAGRGLHRALDVGLGRLGLVGAAASQDHAGSAEASEVPRGLEPQAAVGARHNNSTPGVGSGGHGDGAELPLEEVYCNAKPSVKGRGSH